MLPGAPHISVWFAVEMGFPLNREAEVARKPQDLGVSREEEISPNKME